MFQFVYHDPRTSRQYTSDDIKPLGSVERRSSIIAADSGFGTSHRSDSHLDRITNHMVHNCYRSLPLPTDMDLSSQNGPRSYRLASLA